MKKLTIYTGLDGSGKTTKVRELCEKDKSLKHFYELTEFRNKSKKELFEIYLNYDILDRFFPLDEVVYSKVWNQESKISKEESLNWLRELSLIRDIEINIKLNTYMEYIFVHTIRKEVDYPDYYKSIKEWYHLLLYLYNNIENSNIDLNIYWYDKKLNIDELHFLYNIINKKEQ